MTFLELVQRLRTESRSTASGSSGPTTVVSQTGVFQTLVNLTAEAWATIQRWSTDWLWLRAKFTLPTVASTSSYAYASATDVASSSAISRFRQWLPFDEYGRSNLTIYLTSAGVSGERHLTYMPWGDFRAIYQVGTEQTGTPINFSITPDLKIILGPTPSAVYTLRGEYQKSNQTLSVDADTPEMPTDYHMLIVWEALRQYAGTVGAAEVWTRADNNARELKTALFRNQSPQYHF